MAISHRTLPPRGFVEFCVRNPAACNEAAVTSEPVRLTPERWNELAEVNRTVNHSFAFAQDSVTNGKSEFWDYPKESGDCEDFALEKQRRLIARGWPADALLITVANVPRVGGHAVLVVVTDSGDYVLDILNSSVRGWQDVNYRWLKRQSRGNPQVWEKVTA